MFHFLKKKIFKYFRDSETRLHELNYLFWECTARCNLNCLHCGSDCSKDSSYRDMPLNDFLQAVDTIQEKPENFIVVLTGGEPLLRNDLEILGQEIRRRGMRWGLVTNGYLYTRERHYSLLSAGVGSITISLDGLEETHNWLRNTNQSFSRIADAISLAASSPRLNFDVVTCVNSRNISELPAVYDYLVSKGVKAWRLFTITPIGRAKANPELLLTDIQFREMLDFIQHKRELNCIDVKFSCEGYTGSYELRVRDSYFFCRAGINIGSVLIDGSISACPNIDRSFVQGNIYLDNFYEVWQSKFRPFRNREWTRTGQCEKCADYSFCMGSGMHNWHEGKENVLVCHKRMTERAV